MRSARMRARRAGKPVSSVKPSKEVREEKDEVPENKMEEETFDDDKSRMKKQISLFLRSLFIIHMWTVLRYHLDSVDQQVTPSVQPVDKSVEDILLQDTAKTIEDQIKNYTDNYMISLHYLDFPVVFCYGSKTVPNSKNLSKLVDYIEPYKELVKIVYSGAADIIHGFVFVQKHLEVRKALLDSKDQETFDHLASISGLEPYILNDIRTIWKNKRYEYLSSALPKRIETLYRPNEEHPLYKTVVGYIEDIYRRGVDRFLEFGTVLDP